MLTLPAGLAADNAELIVRVDALVAKHGAVRSALIPVLQDLRTELREIPDLAMQLVADRLDVTPVEVQGVATFYAFLGTRPTGTHVIRLCRTLSCQLAGAGDIAAQLEAELGIKFGETTADGQFSLEWTNCIGMCDRAPALLADTKAVGSVTKEQVSQIISGLRAES